MLDIVVVVEITYVCLTIHSTYQHTNLEFRGITTFTEQNMKDPLLYLDVNNIMPRVLFVMFLTNFQQS